MGDTREYTRFVLYTSLSEGLFWRFCGRREDNAYDKGYNYVTTTFINMDLQLFLFHSMKHFNIIDVEPRPKDCIPYKSIKGSDYNYLHERLTQGPPEGFGKHIDDEAVFNVLNLIFPYGTISNEENYNKSIEKLEKIANITYDNYYHTIVISELYEKLLENNCFEFDGNNRTEFYKRWYRSLTEFFFHFFKIITSKTILIQNRKVFLKDIDEKIINMTINRVTVKNTYKDKVYIIFYIEYNVYEPKLKYKSENYKHIISIVPATSQLTTFGLDDVYVSCGMFVNKIFDYYIQTNITRKYGETKDMHYTFVGDVFNVSQLP